MENSNSRGNLVMTSLEQQRLHLEPGSYFSYNVCEDALPYFFSVVVNRVT